MSHFGRAGPPDITDTYSLLVLNITFRTTPDDLFPLFDKYGKVVDIFIPRDRRTGESRGFAFVRYKYADEAQKAVDRLDGRMVDGREIAVQFAKYGPNAEKIQKGRILESVSKIKSPRRRHRDDYRDRDYSRRRSRSRSLDRYDRDRYRGRDRDYRRRSRSRSYTPERSRGRGRDRYDDERSYRSRSPGSASPKRSASPRRSISPRRSASPRSPSRSRSPSPEKQNVDERAANTRRSASPKAESPHGGAGGSRSPSPKKSVEA
ncbi:Serine/arginine-rich splicing factor SC35 [Bienertia sinuspersici]